MGLFVLEPSKQTQFDIPGTCLFEDNHDDGSNTEQLKRHPRNPEIILRPQPSNSPLDPLSWSRWKKEAYFCTLLYSTALAGVVGPLFIPAFGILSAQFDKPVTDIAKLNGTLVMALGISSFLCVVLSSVIGRRPLYVISVLLYFGGCCWGGRANTYESLYGSRWIQGLGMGAFACLGNATITDIFFLNEAGIRIAMWQLAWVVSVNVTPVISAQVIVSIGWNNAFWVLAGALGPAIFAILIFMPESLYQRFDLPLPSEAASLDGTERIQDEKKMGVAVIDAANEERSSFWSRYGFFNGRISNENIVKLFTTPFVVMFTPSIFWSMIVYGYLFTLNILCGATYSQVFQSPPYAESTIAVGNLSGLPPFIGSVLACLMAGPLSDWSVKKMSLRNNGIFEPEFRLLLMVPTGIFSLIGMLLYGFSAQKGEAVIVPAVGICIMTFGLTFGYVGTIVYSSAVFPKRGGETFGIIMLYKSCFAFGGTYYANDWLAAQGPQEFLGIICAITIALCLTGIPMYVYGKHLRAFASESKVLGWATR